MEDIANIIIDDERVDGVKKVSGNAKFTAEYDIPQMAHAVLVGSTIAKGRIQSFDLKQAKNAGGVIDIITHENKIPVPGLADEQKAKELRLGLRIFHTDEIFFSDQPIAMVIAENLEQAQYAASLVLVSYTKGESVTDFDKDRAPVVLKTNGPDRGNPEAWHQASVKISQEYETPMEVHNPMEMHATIAHWKADNKVILYDKTQGVKGVQRNMAQAFGIPAENITVHAEFVGGAFGSGLRVWPHTIAALMASKKTNRPVKLVLSRPQMFTMVGHRPKAWQKVSIGAESSGKLVGVVHEAIGQTSTYENFTENITGITRILYDIPNLQTKYATLALNQGTPIWMRGPGETTGAFALESAMDELSYALKMDPVALRKKNIPEKDPQNGLPWSSHFFAECLDKGAAVFDWNRRPQAVKTIKKDDWWIGYGVGAGTWRAGRGGATVYAQIDGNGQLELQSAVTDIGPGTGTAMVNIANEHTGIPKNKIVFKLGSSDYPNAPSQGGSNVLSTVGSAVVDACTALKKELLRMAVTADNSFKNAAIEKVVFSQDGLQLESGEKITYGAILKANGVQHAAVTQESGPDDEQKKYSFNSFAVHFAEVHVHALTGVPRVKKFISVVDGGRIVSMKTATSQITGAVVGGIGMALMEEQLYDHRFGRAIANDLAGYHFAVNADAPMIDAQFINKPDPYRNPMGAKGIGEVGIIGAAAAIANAVYNATGIRVRKLPITPEKLINEI